MVEVDQCERDRRAAELTQAPLEVAPVPQPRQRVGVGQLLDLQTSPALDLRPPDRLQRGGARVGLLVLEARPLVQVLAQQLVALLEVTAQRGELREPLQRERGELGRLCRQRQAARLEQLALGLVEVAANALDLGKRQHAAGQRARLARLGRTRNRLDCGARRVVETAALEERDRDRVEPRRRAAPLQLGVDQLAQLDRELYTELI